MITSLTFKISIVFWMISRVLAADPFTNPAPEMTNRPEMTGTTIEPESTPKRIISLAPNLTEILFALGAGSSVIGVTDFDVFPPDVTQLPRLGGYLNPDIEKLIELRPDVVILLQGRIALEKKLNALGIQTWVYPCESYPQLIETIMDLGARLNKTADAIQLTDSITKTLDSVQMVPGYHPRVMLVIGFSSDSLQKVFVAGAGGYINYVIEKLGGLNIFKDISQAYVEVSKEEIIARNPDVILDFSPGSQLSEQDRQHRMGTWNRLSTLNAVRTSKVYILTEDYLLIPGPRIRDTARYLSHILQNTSPEERQNRKR